MSQQPKILIVHASGTNRDEEAAQACALAGGAPEIVHINQLHRNRGRGDQRFADYQMLLIPGGFSYGDALGAGSRMALDMQIYFEDQLQEFIAAGKLVLGICNGFQVLVKAGLLPGNYQNRAGGDAIQREIQLNENKRTVTLTENDSAQFECRWVHLAVNRQAKASILNEIDELIFCPVAHGEGNLQVKDEETLAQLEEKNLIAFRYVDSDGQPANGRYPHQPQRLSRRHRRPLQRSWQRDRSHAPSRRARLSYSKPVKRVAPAWAGPI